MNLKVVPVSVIPITRILVPLVVLVVGGCSDSDDDQLSTHEVKTMLHAETVNNFCKDEFLECASTSARQCEAIVEQVLVDCPTDKMAEATVRLASEAGGGSTIDTFTQETRQLSVCVGTNLQRAFEEHSMSGACYKVLEEEEASQSSILGD